MRIVFASLLIWLSSALSALGSSSVPLDTGKVVASLLSSHYAVTPGQEFDVALKTVLDDKWHTYWRNPGDSGEPVQIRWTLPDGMAAGEITWPLPEPIDTGGIINYGFEGEPLFPVTLSVPATARPGEVIEIVADVYYLVCKDVCIPEDGQLRVAVSVADAPELNAANDAAIKSAIATAPRDAAAAIGAMQSAEDALTFQFTGLPEGDFADAYFFPYDQTVLNHSEPQTVRLAEDGLVIDATPGFGWEEGFTDTKRGVLSFVRNGEPVGRIVTVTPNMSLPVGPVEGGDDLDAPDGALSEITLLGAIFGAFVGGLILNLMPCVFPIISLKALSLAKAAHGERAAARRDGWAYSAGVFATFALLVGVLLAFKAGGAALGWGFQLQNPVIVGLLALLLFAVGLNLIGVFEIAGGSYQNIGSEASMRGGFAGSFFTGALAVLVATPCTAPFMAGAIGFALAQPALLTFLVFMALAAGFAAPFILLAYVPGLLAKLPRPGPWMVRLREVLAFPMFAAAVWLVWVVGNQAGVDGMAILLLAMLALGLGIWLWQRRGVARFAGLAAILLAIAIPFTARTASAPDTVELAASAWSPERVAELRAGGQAVFVDFTADWCVTCKVNERAVLKRAEVQQAFADTNTAFLIGDWTNKNDLIARELESYGRAGVPLYLYFPAGDNPVRGEVLPQVLSVDMVVETLKGS